MATVTVRLPTEEYRWLCGEASANGRTVEAELRALVIKHSKSSVRRNLLTAKERKSLKPDAQAALQKLREMFANKKQA
jgi:hypothetical protein